MAIPKCTLAVKSIESIKDSTELGADEPYVLVVGVDFSNVNALVIDTTRYGPFSISQFEKASTFALPFGTPKSVFDALETLPVVLRRPFWGLLDNQPTPIADLSKIAFVLIMMENDDGNPAKIRDLVHGSALNSLNQLVNNPKVPPKTLVASDFIATISKAFSALLETGVLNGGLNNDDFVGLKELTLSASSFQAPHPAKSELLPRLISRPDEGAFKVVVELAFA